MKNKRTKSQFSPTTRLSLNFAFCLALFAVALNVFAQNAAPSSPDMLSAFDRRDLLRAKRNAARSEQLAPDALGALDRTFGNGGRVATVLPDRGAAPQGIAVQPDGKIVVTARSISATGTIISSYLIRYNADGSLDASFGTNGVVRIPNQSPRFENFQYGLIVQPDGKILVSGSANNAANNPDFAVFRFNADGSRDMTWATNGTASIGIGNQRDFGYQMRLQPDGKIVVVGFAATGATTGDVGVARFNPDGSVDTNFGTNGRLMIPIPTNPAYALSFDFEVLPDGKLLLLGRTTESNFAARRVFLVRVNPNGTLDQSFAANGILLADFNSLNNFTSRFAVQPDGKIVVATGNAPGDGDFQSATIVRYNPDGTLDSGFGTNGTTVVSSERGIFAGDILISPNGKISVGGYTASSDIGVLRLNPNGSIDSAFGTNGVMTTSFGAPASYVSAMMLQADGKLLVFGAKSFDRNDSDLVLVRYLPDAPRPARFDFDGDGRDDIAVFRPTGGFWYWLNSSDNSFAGLQWGIASDKIVPADYDGDRRTDHAVFRDGFWYILQSSNNGFRAVQFGQTGDRPLPGDYDGDGRADFAVFRAGFWYIQNSSNNSFRAEQFGSPTDVPVPADYDGDDKLDFVVFRDGNWYIRFSGSSSPDFRTVRWGLPGDKPVPADYDGDTYADFAVFRDGVWHISSFFNSRFTSVQFGVATDKPVAADYDGDGRADFAVFRDGNWYIQNSSNNQFRAVQFGLPTDVPVQTAYLP